PEREKACDGLTAPCGDPRRPAPIAASRPQRRAKDAPPVERESREQIEDREREVDERELLEHVRDRLALDTAQRLTRRETQQPERPREQEARERPDRRHEEFGS